MMHLSRLSEEYILYCSQEFAFFTPSDLYSTGSSIMPQKKNPDMAELIRGKTGRTYGGLMNILTIMKGLPLSYNKDMQEGAIPLFDITETVNSCLVIATGMLKTTKFNKDKMETAVKKGFMNATAAADYLVGKGMAFRDAHKVIGELVAIAEKKGLALEDLDFSVFKKASDLFDEDIFAEIEICYN
jgi:argininosuccinate lyase